MRLPTLSGHCVPSRCLAALACLALAHCASPTPPAQAISSLSEIEGQWDIIEFDGYRPKRLDGDGNRHAFVDIADGRLAFSIECNYSGMPARIDAPGRLIESEKSDLVQTTMGCGDVRNRREAKFFAFFHSAPAVSMLESGVLRLENSNTALVLQRAEITRRNNLPASLSEIEGRWTADIIYHQLPGSSRNLIAFLEGAPADIEISSGNIRLAFDCEAVEGKVTLTAPGDLRVDPSSLNRRTTSACRIPKADRDLAVSLLSETISVERIDARRLHLVSGEIRAVAARTS